VATGNERIRSRLFLQGTLVRQGVLFYKSTVLDPKPRFYPPKLEIEVFPVWDPKKREIERFSPKSGVFHRNRPYFRVLRVKTGPSKVSDLCSRMATGEPQFLTKFAPVFSCTARSCDREGISIIAPVLDPKQRSRGSKVAPGGSISSAGGSKGYT